MDSAKGFGEIIKKLRKENGFTAMQVAEIIGKSDSTISAWETGKASPDIDTFFILCELYNVDDINKTFAIKKDSSPEDEEILINYFRQLNKEGQEKVISYIVDLVDTGKYKKR